MTRRPPVIDRSSDTSVADPARPPGAGSDDAVLVIDTKAVGPTDRFEFWRSAFTSAPMPITLESERRAGFSGLFELYAGSSLSFGDIRTSLTHDAVRGRGEISRSAMDMTILMTIKRGTVVLEQNGKTVVGRPGDTILMFQNLWLRSGQKGVCDFRNTNIPAAAFPDAIRGRTPLLISTANSPLASVVSSYFRAIPRDSQTLARAGDLLQDQLVALVVRALAVDWEASTRERRLIEAIRSAVEVGIADPDLSAKMLCQGLGVSRTALFQAVAAEGGTLANMILDRRLAGCIADMQAPGRTETLAAISERWGFRSQSAFNRAFRRRHGTSPLLWRSADADPA